MLRKFLINALTEVFWVVGIQLAGYGFGFLAVLELGYKGRTWKKLAKWYESKSNPALTVLVYITFPVWIGLFLAYMSLGGLGFIFGGGKAAEIQAQVTGEDYLGQHDDWIDHYVEVVYPLLVADRYSYGGQLRIEESYIHFMRSLKDRPRGKISISEEEANRWHVDAFKEWLEQTKSQDLKD